MAKPLFAFVVLMTIQYAFSAPFSFKWCALPQETSKCDVFKTYVEKTAQNLSLEVAASCVAGNTTEDCMTKIKDGQADLVTLGGGDIYKAGKNYSLVPIVSEQYGEYGVKYYAIAVVKKNNTGFDITSLKGKKTCHTGVGRTAGWIVPMGYLLGSKTMPAMGCGNVNKNFISASKYFNESCVPGAPTEFSNLCELCAGTGADKCSPNETKNEYAGHEGAFACMAEGKGDVAFVKHKTTQKVVDKRGHGKWADYEYLCRDGDRKEADQSSHKSCHIGFSPALAVVTRKGNTNIPNIIKILMAMSDWYGDKQKDWSKFQLFNSSSYSGSNLIFRDSATELKAIAIANQTYMRYLGNYGKDLKAFMSCDFLSTTPRPIIAVSTVTSPATALALLVALFSILLL